MEGGGRECDVGGGVEGGCARGGGGCGGGCGGVGGGGGSYNGYIPRSLCLSVNKKHMGNTQISTLLLCFLYLFVELVITMNEESLFKPLKSPHRFFILDR